MTTHECLEIYEETRKKRQPYDFVCISYLSTKALCFKKTNWLNNKTLSKSLSKQNKNNQPTPSPNKIKIKNRNEEGERRNISGKDESFVDLRHILTLCYTIGLPKREKS